MNVIFLDIDGVLNSQEYYHHIYNIYKETGKHVSHHFVDETPLNLLINYLNSSSTKLVISSSWKYSNNPEETIKQFDSYDPECINIAKLNKFIIGCTPRIYKEGSCRGTEIKWWLDNHPEINKYVIIDDDSDMLSEHLPYFIKTQNKYGLKQCHIDKIIKILK